MIAAAAMDPATAFGLFAPLAATAVLIAYFVVRAQGAKARPEGAVVLRDADPPQQAGGAAKPAAERRVVLVAIRVPFWDLVGTMILWGVAALPAILVLYLVGLLVQLFVLAPLGLAGAAAGALSR